MGGLSLTNPGLVYQDQQLDPVTGQPVVKPRVSFFPNNAKRAQAFAQQESAAINPSTSDVNGTITPTGAPSDTTVSNVPGAVAPVPKFFKPSFTSTLTDPTTGLPAPVNPAQTKLGKLVTILGAAARGGLAGWGYGNPAQGAAAAREIPFQQAGQRQELEKGQAQTELLRAQSSMIPTPYGPMPLGMARYLFPSLIGAQGKVAAAQIGAGAKIGAAQIGQGMALPVPETVANLAGFPELANTPVGKATWGNINAAIRAKGYQFKDLGDEGTWVVDRTGNRISRVGDSAGMAPFMPTVTTKSESTDVMGNTSSRGTTQKVAPAPIVAPGGAPAPANLVQRTAGGPLVQQGGTPQTPRRAASPPSPASTGAAPAPAAGPVVTPAVPGAAPAPAANSPATSSLQLPPDVEQRLAAYPPQQQGLLRGLLNYRATLSPRAKNYSLLVGALTTLDPSWDETMYPARQKLQTRFIGGDYADQRLAFNTAIQHLGQLNDAAASVGNGNVQLLNSIANRYHVAIGQSPVVTFNHIRDAVSGELSKVYKGTVTEGELNRVGGNISSDMAPRQIADVTGAAIGLMSSKMNELANIYETGMGRKVPFQMLSPDAGRVLQRMPGAGPSHEVYSPDGSKLIGHVVNNKYVPVQ